jgi:hypothetical protein
VQISRQHKARQFLTVPGTARCGTVKMLDGYGGDPHFPCPYVRLQSAFSVVSPILARKFSTCNGGYRALPQAGNHGVVVGQDNAMILPVVHSTVRIWCIRCAQQ